MDCSTGALAPVWPKSERNPLFGVKKRTRKYRRALCRRPERFTLQLVGFAPSVSQNMSATFQRVYRCRVLLPESFTLRLRSEFAPSVPGTGSSSGLSPASGYSVFRFSNFRMLSVKSQAKFGFYVILFLIVSVDFAIRIFRGGSCDKFFAISYLCQPQYFGNGICRLGLNFTTSMSPDES